MQRSNFMEIECLKDMRNLTCWESKYKHNLLTNLEVGVL
jgi:hypothetical protein